MKIEHGKCLKCGCTIISNRQPTSLWTQRGYICENGNIAMVGLCRNCYIEPDEYYFVSNLLGLDSKIKAPHKKEDDTETVDTITDILKAAQDGRCALCGKKLTGNYAISGNRMTCEVC